MTPLQKATKETKGMIIGHKKEHWSTKYSLQLLELDASGNRHI